MPVEQLEPMCARAINFVLDAMGRTSEETITRGEFFGNQAVVALLGDHYAADLGRREGGRGSIMNKENLAQNLDAEKSCSLLAAIMRLASLESRKLQGHATKLSKLSKTQEAEVTTLRRENHEAKRELIALRRDVESFTIQKHKMALTERKLLAAERQSKQLQDALLDLGLDNEIAFSNQEAAKLLHAATSKLMSRYSVEEAGVGTTFKELKVENQKLRKDVRVTARLLRVETAKLTDLELQISRRDAQLYEVNKKLTSMERERDSLVSFCIEAFGKDKLIDLLVGERERRSSFTSPRSSPVNKL